MDISSICRLVEAGADSGAAGVQRDGSFGQVRNGVWDMERVSVLLCDVDCVDDCRWRRSGVSIAAYADW